MNCNKLQYGLVFQIILNVHETKAATVPSFLFAIFRETNSFIMFIIVIKNNCEISKRHFL